MSERLPAFRAEAWDGGEDLIITINGKPIGSSGYHNRDAKIILDWLPTAWIELRELILQKRK